MTNPNITIFGYVVRKGYYLCPKCFTNQGIVWFDAILRNFHAEEHEAGLHCHECNEVIFSPTAPSVPDVFREFIETLDV